MMAYKSLAFTDQYLLPVHATQSSFPLQPSNHLRGISRSWWESSPPESLSYWSLCITLSYLGNGLTRFRLINWHLCQRHGPRERLEIVAAVCDLLLPAGCHISWEMVRMGGAAWVECFSVWLVVRRSLPTWDISTEKLSRPALHCSAGHACCWHTWARCCLKTIAM